MAIVFKCDICKREMDRLYQIDLWVDSMWFSDLVDLDSVHKRFEMHICKDCIKKPFNELFDMRTKLQETGLFD